jgi:hypothetical protein
MKKIGTIFLILVAFSASSQNWNLVDENKTYFYKHIDSLYITNTIKIDSTTNSALDSVFHIHTTIKICDTCTVIPSDAVGGVVYHAYSPEIFGNTPTYNVSSNDYEFSDGTIKQHAALSDSWIFSASLSINATVVDKYETTLFGSLDSVKVIELSSLDTIIISKNHGVIRYPDFENAGKYFLLGGYHEGQNSFGEYLPNMWRIYDFNVGDEFYFNNQSDNGGIWEFHTRHIKIKILEDLSTPTDAAYRVKFYMTTTSQYGWIEDAYYVYSATNYIDTLQLTLSNACYENSYSGFMNQTSSWDYDHTFYNNPFAPSELLSLDYFVGDQYARISHHFDIELGYQKKYSLMKINSDSLAYYSTMSYTDCYGSFTEGLGRDTLYGYGFEAGEMNYLVGYVKAGITTGTIYNFPEDLSIDLSEQDKLVFYPNPANDIIHVPENLNSLVIYNQLGSQVLRIENLDKIVSLADLPAGVYIITGSDQNGNQLLNKLIIE